METKPLSAMPKLKTNLDTDFLKLIAILSMVIDHVGTAFFPEYPAFRWAGRLAFPIFAYCLTVGLLYTRDIRKYLLRLGAFALISQPFYIFAFHPWDWQAEWMNMNIFFTLLVSLLALWGVHTRRWWLFLALFLLASFVNFDYSANGIVLMLIFYLCRNRPVLGAAVYVLFWLPALWGGPNGGSPQCEDRRTRHNWTISLSCLPFPSFSPPTQASRCQSGFSMPSILPIWQPIGLARVILNV